MVIDKGLGFAATGDLLEMAGDYIDTVKFISATSALMDVKVLMGKVRLLKTHDIWAMPGGTFMEIALWQGKYPKYLRRCKKLGFNAIEISDGTIDCDLKTRRDCIKRAVDAEFRVVTEVGKKNPDNRISFDILHKEIASDLECGASAVIIEAREAGRGVGIYSPSSKVKEDAVTSIIVGVDDITKLDWEAPLKHQQQYLILRFGVNVSLSNVPPGEALTLEALRNNLRCDTLRVAWEANREFCSG